MTGQKPAQIRRPHVPKKNKTKNPTSCMRKISRGRAGKGCIKNQVTYPKKGLLYLESGTCDQTQDKRDAERPRLKGPASCFTGLVEDAQMITVPCVSYVPCHEMGFPVSWRWKRGDGALIKGESGCSGSSSNTQRSSSGGGGGPRSPNARLSQSVFQKKKKKTSVSK